MTVAARMVELHDRLATVGVPHAFGGALALAWCTRQARGTIDIDVNVFVAPTQCDEVLAAMPSDIDVSDEHRASIDRDGQVRLWWDETPVDLFFNTTPFHHDVAGRIRWEPFTGRDLPFLSCRDLAVFKVFFNRTKDWADLEAMHEVGALDIDWVLAVVTRLLGPDDERIPRLRAL